MPTGEEIIAASTGALYDMIESDPERKNKILDSVEHIIENHKKINAMMRLSFIGIVKLARMKSLKGVMPSSGVITLAKKYWAYRRMVQERLIPGPIALAKFETDLDQNHVLTNVLHTIFSLFTDDEKTEFYDHLQRLLPICTRFAEKENWDTSVLDLKSEGWIPLVINLNIDKKNESNRGHDDISSGGPDREAGDGVHESKADQKRKTTHKPGKQRPKFTSTSTTRN